MNRLSTDWQSTTPAGYPTMPGYQVGTPAAETQTQYAQTQYAQTQYAQPGHVQQQPGAVDMREFEHAYQRPSADAIDRGVMTYDDVIVRMGAMLALLTGTAALSWFVTMSNPRLGMILLLVGALGGLGMALVNSFSRNVGAGKVSAYAALEGLALGAISAVMEASAPGIVVQALLGTIAVFGVTLILFSSGKVRNSSKLMKFTLIGIVALLAFRLLSFLLTVTGVISQSLESIQIAGINLPLGVLVGAIAVLLGAFSLIQDFDTIQQGVRNGAPSQFAWYATFGLLVTIVWMYMEILRLLSYFRE